jgi:hypothetical protein
MANPIVDQVTQAVTAAKSVEEAATALILGIQGRIDDAVQKAIANGATDAELQPLKDLSSALASDTAALTAAITANTPVTPAQAKAKKP